jgi:hypothetical protein
LSGAITAVLGVALVAAAVIKYDALLRMVDTSSKALRPGHPGWVGLAGIAIVGFPFVTAYAVGLFQKSEEVRRSSVEAVQASLLAGVASLLLYIPRSMQAGPLKSLAVGALGIPSAALAGLTVVALVSLVGDLVWLALSTRTVRRLDSQALRALAERFRVELHIAAHGSIITLPGPDGAKPVLPLLVSGRHAAVLARALVAFPRLSNVYIETVLEGLKGPYAISSLLLSALQHKTDVACERCLSLMAARITREWPARGNYASYSKPSSSFTMNALEYAARRLCHLTNLEELMVVR